MLCHTRERMLEGRQLFDYYPFWKREPFRIALWYICERAKSSMLVWTIRYHSRQPTSHAAAWPSVHTAFAKSWYRSPIDSFQAVLVSKQNWMNTVWKRKRKIQEKPFQFFYLCTIIILLYQWLWNLLNFCYARHILRRFLFATLNNTSNPWLENVLACGKKRRKSIQIGKERRLVLFDDLRF